MCILIMHFFVAFAVFATNVILVTTLNLLKKFILWGRCPNSHLLTNIFMLLFLEFLSNSALQLLPIVDTPVSRCVYVCICVSSLRKRIFPGS